MAGIQEGCLSAELKMMFVVQHAERIMKTAAKSGLNLAQEFPRFADRRGEQERAWLPASAVDCITSPQDTNGGGKIDEKSHNGQKNRHQNP
jgi:hypothetical protein